LLRGTGPFAKKINQLGFIQAVVRNPFVDKAAEIPLALGFS